MFIVAFAFACACSCTVFFSAQNSHAQVQETPDQIFQHAMDLFRNNRYDEAALEYSRVFMEFPDHPFAPQSMLEAARCSEVAGRLTDAVEIYAAAAERYPEDRQVLDAHYQMSSLYERLGMPDEAVEAMRTMVKNAREHQRDNFTRLLIELYIRLDRLYEAQTLAEKQLKKNPGDISFMTVLASSYEKEGDYDKSVDIYKKILELNPNNTAIENRYFEALEKTGGLDEEIEKLEAWKQGEPDNMEPVHRLKRLYLWADRSLDALVNLEIIVEHEPDNLNDAVALAQHYYNNQWITKSKELLNRILTTHPNYEPALRQLGNIYFKEDDMDAAIGAWKRAAAFDPKEKAAYLRLSNYFMQFYLYADAAENYEQGRISLGDPLAFANELAFIYRQQMQMEKALGEYILLSILRPQDMGISNTMFEIATSADIQDRGIDILRQAVIDYPPKTHIKRTLAEVLFAKGRPDEAMDVVKTTVLSVENSSQFLNELSARLATRGDHTDAAVVSEFGSENSTGPGRAFFLLQAGRSWLSAGKPHKAIRVLELLAEEQRNIPGVDEALIHLAKVSEELGEYKNARGYYARLAGEHPASAWFEEALVGEARCAFYSGDFKRAAESFEALGHRPGSARYFDSILYFRAEASLFDLKVQPASELYSKLVDQYPESRWVNDAIQRLLFIEDVSGEDTLKLQAFIEAEKRMVVDDFDAAESIYRGLFMTEKEGAVPEHAGLGLGVLLRRAGRNDEAVEVLEELSGRYPESELRPRALYMLAEIYLDKGKNSESLRRCQDLLSDYPGSYWSRRARVLAGKMIDG